MLRIVIRVLVVDSNPLVRRAITSVTSVPGLDDVVLTHREAEMHAEALDALRGGNVDAVIIDPVLGEPTDRRGMVVIWTAYERGIPVFVHTAQRLEDRYQRELAEKEIPMLVKSVDPLTLNDMTARRALSVDKPINPLREALQRIANALRAVSNEDMPISEVVNQAEALAAHSAIIDHKGIKTSAAESLGVNRDYVNRRLADLPRDRVSETRLRAHGPVKASPQDPRKVNGRSGR